MLMPQCASNRGTCRGIFVEEEGREGGSFVFY